MPYGYNVTDSTDHLIVTLLIHDPRKPRFAYSMYEENTYIAKRQKKRVFCDMRRGVVW